MEAILRLVSQLADLIKTRFREMTIIAMGFSLWKLSVGYKELNDAFRESEKNNTQQIISIFENNYQRNARMADSVYVIVNMAREIMEMNNKNHGK